ncbi:response regulator [Massilia sp. G4R7]|uniref:histidine kinase n=1 Tax=Massilia phyllostachyos TaxID=2898585 RepID=A0ABS8QF89_9BURK|nr:response regulator [Massilia phyllostachyos]MCD2519695.1 response regulator [Massilia phyllostachyos]
MMNKPTRVLLIDDHRINAELVAGMLDQEPDLALDYLQEPGEAVRAARAFGPSVIMVDLHMPVFSGFDVIRALKEAPDLAPIPIIMLSSNDSPQVKATGFTAGAMDYLVKWPDRIELAARLRAHARAHAATRERDQAMQALAASQAALLERTRELADAQASLHEAQKMEAIGQLTNGIAHDFNNVLQLITGHLQLLRMMHKHDEKTVRRVEAASEGVRRGARIAGQLHAFARRQPLTPVTMPVDAHLRSMEAAIAGVLAGRSFAITSSGETALAALDPVQFGNSVLHLVRNAADAMGADGHLTITIDRAPLPGGAEGQGDADHVRVRLRDNGAGMSEEVQRRAFEPFFSTRGGRRGLGLSLAFGFVKQSGGQIELTSASEDGTTVSLYFPATHAASPRQEGGTRTVLVVEDEAAVREVCVEVLRKQGLYVLEAADGETALGLIRQRLPIDLLFTDIVMPGGVTGQDLARAAAEHLPYAKVLFASGYPAGLHEEGELVQCTQLLHKPYRLDEMTRVVRGLLEV